jgi:Protein of unknown function (DUF1573)
MKQLLTRASPLLGLLPFLIALVCAAAATRPCPLSAPPARLPLVFRQYAVNLREVPARPIIEAYFDFANRGDQPVRITELKASCGCLAPRLLDRRLSAFRRDDQETFLPGERGRFSVSVRTANEEPGPHAYTVNVKYEDSVPHEQLVGFRVTLPERKLSVEPSELYFYPAPGQSESQTTWVTDYRGGDIDVLDATCQIDFVKLEVLPRETDDLGNPRVPVRVTVPGDFPPGRHTGILTLHTSDPEFERIFAAVLVHGQSRIQPAGFDDPVSDE